MRGISPLIGAIVLIGFTILVAGILTFWIQGLTQRAGEELATKTEREIKCSFAGISIYDVAWDSSTNELKVSIANIGTVDFTDVNVQVHKGGDTIAQQSAGSLNSADIKTITFTGISSKPDAVTIIPKDCPRVKDEESQITEL